MSVTRKFRTTIMDRAVNVPTVPTAHADRGSE